jgi:predicted nucleic acid-binding protein
MTDAVLDAGPLIHLAELDALDVLCDFSSLLVPEAVWFEVERHFPEALFNEQVSLQRVKAPRPSPTLAAMALSLALNRGELEALSLMDLYPYAILLTDDSAARLAAEQRCLKAHGTTGLLIRSVRKDRRTEKDIISLLRNIPNRSSLYVRSSLLNEIITALEAEWNKKP